MMQTEDDAEMVRLIAESALAEERVRHLQGDLDAALRIRTDAESGLNRHIRAMKKKVVPDAPVT